MAEYSEVWGRINEHEKWLSGHDTRLATAEKDIEQMAPKIHVMEVVAGLQQDISALRHSVETSAKATNEAMSRLAKDMATLSALNEESMQRAGEIENEKRAEEREKHKAEMAQMARALEDSKPINRLKAAGAVAGVMLAIFALLAALWNIAHWMLVNLTK